MDDDQTPKQTMTLTLHALYDGTYTQLALTGPVATTPRRKELRRLLALLSLWHGGPVDVVLCVGPDTAGWLEIWDEALRGVPARHALIRFRISRDSLQDVDGNGVDGNG